MVLGLGVIWYGSMKALIMSAGAILDRLPSEDYLNGIKLTLKEMRDSLSQINTEVSNLKNAVTELKRDERQERA
jgi:KaiC/GvpD/RAD55 family RecA-like ATPase